MVNNSGHHGISRSIGLPPTSGYVIFRRNKIRVSSYGLLFGTLRPPWEALAEFSAKLISLKRGKYFARVVS